MAIINTDELTLIGAGSEWFWTALSGIVLVVTLVAIYRQLRLQVAAQAYEQVRRIASDWDNNESMMRYQLAALEEGLTESEPGLTPATSTIANYWEGIGSLARSGHIDLDILYEIHGFLPAIWFEYLRDQIRYGRSIGGEALYSEFEWLNDQLRKRGAADRRGAPFYAMDNELIENQAIPGIRRSIDIQEASRVVGVTFKDAALAQALAALMLATKAGEASASVVPVPQAGGVEPE